VVEQSAVLMREAWAEAFAERARAHWTPERTADLTRGKKLAIRPDEAPELLRALGLLHRDGSMPPRQRRKFFQVNHVVAMLGPALRELSAAKDTIRVVDAACGRSYLTVVLAWVLGKHGARVEVLGVDREERLVEESRRRTEIAGLAESVRHHAARLDGLDVRAAWHAQYGAEPEIDVVVALHACDTATDDALVLGVELGATLVAAAPCCQAELARKWEAMEKVGAFAPIQRTPHLRRETAALVTDTMRQLLLRSVGYDCAALELVPSEHTPKNLLLRAMRRTSGDATAREEYERLKAATGGEGIGLSERLARAPG
jgi:protein-L-isoaspartate O-methyltransferase